MMLDQRCDTCRFWDRPPGDGLLADCKRHAPTMVAGQMRDMEDEDRMFALWPQTACDDWCGEYEASKFTAAGGTPLIDVEGLDVRTIRRLEHIGVTRIEQLAGVTEGELLAIPGFGPTCYDRVRAALTRLGLKLKDAHAQP